MATAATLNLLIRGDARGVQKASQQTVAAIHGIEQSVKSVQNILKAFGAVVGIGKIPALLQKIETRLAALGGGAAADAVNALKSLKTIGDDIYRGLAPAIAVAARGFRGLLDDALQLRSVAAFVGQYATELTAVAVGIGGAVLAMKAWTMATQVQVAWQKVLLAFSGPAGWAALAAGVALAAGAYAFLSEKTADAAAAANNSAVEDAAKRRAAAVAEATKAAAAEVAKWREEFAATQKVADDFMADIETKIRQFDMTDVQKDLDNLYAAMEKANKGPLNSQQVDEFNKAKALREQLDLMEQQKKAADELAEAEKKAAEDEKRRREQLAEQLKRQGEEMKESMMTPLEKYRAKINEITQQLARKNIDPITASRAADAAEKSLAEANKVKDIGKELESPKALLKGSADAELANDRQTTPWEKMTSAQEKQLAESKKQTQIGRELVNAAAKQQIANTININ